MEQPKSCCDSHLHDSSLNLPRGAQMTTIPHSLLSSFILLNSLSLFLLRQGLTVSHTLTLNFPSSCLSHQHPKIVDLHSHSQLLQPFLQQMNTQDFPPEIKWPNHVIGSSYSCITLKRVVFTTVHICPKRLGYQDTPQSSSDIAKQASNSRQALALAKLPSHIELHP